MPIDDHSRRRLLFAMGALPWAALAPRGALGAERLAAPPRARIEPVRETLWGETIVDPYRWMENAEDPDWLPFMQGQDRYARGVLGHLPGRAALGRRISALSGSIPLPQAPVVANGRLFYELRAAGASQFALCTREGEAGAERALIDTSTMRDGGSHVSLDWWSPSPDGRHVAYGLSPAGSEQSVLHILELSTGRLLPERIDRTPYASPNWLPDGSGFFYGRMAEGRSPGAVDYFMDSACWLHRLGTDPQQDQRVLARGQYADFPVERNEFPFVATETSSAHVVASAFGGVRRDNALYVARRDELIAGRPRWLKVCDLQDEVVGFALRGEALFLLSTRDAPNGKVLRTTCTAPDLRSAALVVPESRVVIEGMVAARDGLYVHDIDGGYGSLRRLDADGRIASVPLPFDGTIETLTGQPDAAGIWMLGTGWLLPFTVYRHDGGAAPVRPVALAPAPAIDLTRFEAIRSEAVARDGTRVPLSIVARKGLPRDRRRPTLVDAYGSYQTVSSPYFTGRSLAFLEQGGVLATAHVRGGGEYGRRWWIDGQKLAKPNTWRDLIDCCEALVRQGWTSPRHLGIQGGSAGGITVGRALTERPDLFCAVVSDVGVSNTLRAEFSQNGPPNIDEFGTVTDRAGFLALKQMDSTQAVRNDVRYPAVLLNTGMTDPRVEPWQVAKMAAHLQAVPVQRAPVLLRVDFDAGHGIGSTREQIDELRADEFAFLLWRAGHLAFRA